MDRIVERERLSESASTHAPLRALIVDDEPLARRGLEIRLEAHPDVEIVGQFGDGLSAIAGMRELRPDLVFLDVQMPGVDGFETLRSIPAHEMPLVENAIKYAVAKQVAGGLLRIEAQRDGGQLVLRVIDDGPGCTSLEGNQLPPGKGVGLRNTRERLNVLYGDESSFSVRNRERGIEVELRLPFETKQLGGE